MVGDISQIVRSWQYDPKSPYRKQTRDDGSEFLQARIDQCAFQGIMQMELDRRPDGIRPHGFDYLFDFYKEGLRIHMQTNGTDAGFELTPKACYELVKEGGIVLKQDGPEGLLYQRYVFLLQMEDYNRVARDTEMAMGLSRFVNRYARRKEDRMYLEIWRPYLLRINGVARAMIEHKKENYDSALEIIEGTREKIMALDDIDCGIFRGERERSEKALDDLEQHIREKKPKTEQERAGELKERLRIAVNLEEYEEAAKIRDEIGRLEARMGKLEQS